LYLALYLFPMEPGQGLVKARLEQELLRGIVEAVKAGEDWLRDPLLAQVVLPKEVQEDAAKTPIHQAQARVGIALSLLKRQCEHVAATSQPADDGGQGAGSAGTPPGPPLVKGGKAGSPGAGPADEQKEPMLDPELNRKLADALKGVDDLEKKCLAAIVVKDQKATLAAQDELLKVIDAALELLPKTIEQKITELIVRQARLNSEVQAEAGAGGPEPKNAAVAALDEARKWAIRFKSKLLGVKPAQVADALSTRQQGIRAGTQAVNEEVRQKIPGGAEGQAGAGSPPPASQPAEQKANIEASKHLTEAENHMGACLKGFEQAIVEDSLRPMQSGGAVQTGQGKALEELVKALAALKPPATQPNQDQEDQKKQQQQQQPQEQDQDKQREVEQMDKERERVERELQQREKRIVIKDW